MNEKCKNWRVQLQNLRVKHAEFGQAYGEALNFAEHNPNIRETSFTRCRILFNEIKPLVMKLKEEVNPSFKYNQIVNRLTLSPDATLNKNLQEKLLEMVSEKNYNEAVATAKELDPMVKVPTRKEIIKNLLDLGFKKLEKIATIMSKPELMIVPNKSIDEMKEAMNANPHYDNQTGAYFPENYGWSGRPGKVSVCVVDMVQYSPVVSGQKPDEQRNDEQLRICEKYFSDNGMSLISDTQYATGMQKSLRTYAQAKTIGESNPEKHILDFRGRPQYTASMFNQEHNTAIKKVAFGDFDTNFYKIEFRLDKPDYRFDHLRGRGVAQVM